MGKFVFGKMIMDIINNMPTYDYKCVSCGRIESHLHKMNETLNISCEDCSYRMEKCISAGIGIHFKGNGFYETDYKE